MPCWVVFSDQVLHTIWEQPLAMAHKWAGDAASALGYIGGYASILKHKTLILASPKSWWSTSSGTSCRGFALRISWVFEHNTSFCISSPMNRVKDTFEGHFEIHSNAGRDLLVRQRLLAWNHYEVPGVVSGTPGDLLSSYRWSYPLVLLNSHCRSHSMPSW